MKTDNPKLQCDKSEKSLIHCNTLKRNLQGVNLELNIQKRVKLGKETDSEKSINHMQQTQYKGCLKENPKTMMATLSEFQNEISEKLIILPKELRCDMKQMEQMFAPVDIPARTCYQTVPNNLVVEQTDEIIKADL